MLNKHSHKKYYTDKKIFLFFIVAEIILLAFALCFFVVFLNEGHIAAGYAVLSFMGLMMIIIFIAILHMGTGTIVFTENCFIYKKSLFSEAIAVEYKDIFGVLIDFATHPMGLKSAIGPCIYIRLRGKNHLVIHITYGVVKELISRVDCKKIKIGYERLTAYNKKYRALTWDCLNSVQKADICKRKGGEVPAQRER